ncbi:sigma 54-interacting transcriptional regulator [candidate division KSB1 bacterium]|nr:sigma 54-interacting transcriptional regulator [candidate division KSB1 bacterium]
MKNLIDLLDENNFLRLLFESIPLGVMLIRSDQRILAVNDFMKQSFGISEAQLVDTRMGNAVQCVQANRTSGVCGGGAACRKCQVMNPALAALRGNKTWRSKAEFQMLANGAVQTKDVLVTAVPIEFEHRHYAMVLLEDITELSTLRRQITAQQRTGGFIGQDPKVIALREKIKVLADVDMPVLIQGESGTGKELVAKAIHEQGSRANKPFIAVNCGALPETLLESELFGHVKGAFTGAIRDKKGRFELADEGTIFLDEIGDISPTMQVKLLRVLQEGTFEPVGGEKTITVDVRLISATNRNIKKQIEAGEFREDLFYRICVVPVFIPPLRERPTDILLLAEHILNATAIGAGKKATHFSPDALDRLASHDWPGNVRELQNAIQYALVHCNNETIDVEHLPPTINPKPTSEKKSNRKPRKRKLNLAMVKNALHQANGNRVKAAEILGVSRATLYRFFESIDSDFPE